MAPRELPRRPSLEHLCDESRDLQRRCRAGDPDALAFLAEHHPRPVSAPDLRLTSARVAVARSYGFPSWPTLREHVETINRWFRRPDETEVAADGDLVDRLLALACLVYGGDARHRLTEAAALLTAHADLATASPHAMAAAGEGDALRAAIAADPDAVHRAGGPFHWEPLLYATYARIPGRSTLPAVEVLLDAGADPNAGYLWDGQYAFTALTGVLGGGEEWPNQPAHPDAPTVARRLLEAGADPNDTQAVYNRMFLPDDAPYELLFAFGLGRDDAAVPTGPWPARLGPRAWPVADALQLALHWACGRGFVGRVRLFLAHGIDPNGDPHHPATEGRSHVEVAERAGNREIARLLLDAGARPVELGPVERFVAACLRADRAEVASTRTDELVRRAEEDHAPLAHAARLGRAASVRLMLDIGFDVNAGGESTALHEAAYIGDLELVRVLVERGADPTIRDARFDGTAAGWAAYAGQDDVVRYLASLGP